MFANTFKNRLDKLWANQDLIFDLNADDTGIGSRSMNSLSCMSKCSILFRYGQYVAICGLGPGFGNPH